MNTDFLTKKLTETLTKKLTKWVGVALHDALGA
jgi:hypothetical protein